MKNRYRLYRRTKGGVFYAHDSTTGKQESLGTRDVILFPDEAENVIAKISD